MIQTWTRAHPGEWARFLRHSGESRKEGAGSAALHDPTSGFVRCSHQLLRHKFGMWGKVQPEQVKSEVGLRDQQHQRKIPTQLCHFTAVTTEAPTAEMTFLNPTWRARGIQGLDLPEP